MSATPSSSPTTFEDKLARMEEISRTVQSGCPLHRLVELIREGETLHQQCCAELQLVETELSAGAAASSNGSADPAAGSHPKPAAA